MHEDHDEIEVDVGGGSRKGAGVFTCLVQAMLAIGCVMTLIALNLEAVQRTRRAARRTECRNNLRQITIALRNYHDDYGVFPPARTVNADGESLHNWRTLILPYFSNLPAYRELYETIDLSKAWDDPVNQKAYETSLRVYTCPSTRYEETPLTFTTYLAAVTPNGALHASEPRPLTSINSPHYETLLVVEVPKEHAVHWMSPSDADQQVIGGVGAESEFAHTGGSFAACVDCSLRFIEAKDLPGKWQSLRPVSEDQE